ncbi:hypothetical protein RRG08_012273 [Elysia crispata]|uniref:Uncharacterized protein n=1 Tax=Elysia crispata TaxID=231223 RepID=A0AAE1BAX9_9GAST|nr:hypothetical protein RRG08_012273 [Elysia crispata]
MRCLCSNSASKPSGSQPGTITDIILQCWWPSLTLNCSDKLHRFCCWLARPVMTKGAEVSTLVGRLPQSLGTTPPLSRAVVTQKRK